MFTNRTHKHKHNTHTSEVAATKIASAYQAHTYQAGRYGERYGDLEVHYIEPMIVSEEDEYRATTLQDVWTPVELVVENEEAKKTKAKVQRSAPAPVVKKEQAKVQRDAPAPKKKEEPKVEVKIVEKIVEVEKYVEVEVLVEKIVYKDVIKYVDVVVEREVQVPVEVERRVEVPVPYEEIVIVPVHSRISLHCVLPRTSGTKGILKGTHRSMLGLHELDVLTPLAPGVKMD